MVATIGETCRVTVAPANNRMNLTVRPVTRLAGLLLVLDSHGSAQGARPSRPAGYAERYAVFPGVAYILKRRFNS